MKKRLVISTILAAAAALSISGAALADGFDFGKLAEERGDLAVEEQVVDVEFDTEDAKQPILGHLLTPYQYYNYTWYDNNGIDSFLMMGQKYYQGLTLQYYSSGKTAFFNLDQSFDSISFDVGHLDDARNGSATLYIYLDEELVKEVALSEDMITQRVELDTTGVHMMELYEVGGDAGYGYANITGYGGHVYRREMSKSVSVKNDGEYTYICDQCGTSYHEAIPCVSECVPLLSPYQMENMEAMENTEDPTDGFLTMGVLHTTGCRFEYYNNYKEALYNLGQQLSSVMFSVGHIDGARDGDAIMQIFCDGNLMQEIPLTFDMVDKKITINTSGVMQLKISYSGSDSAYGIYDMSYDIITPLEHKFIDQVVLEPTETMTGIRTFTCSNCGASYSEAIPMK